MHFEEKPVIGPKVNGKAKLITDSWILFEGWQQDFKEPELEGDVHIEYSRNDFVILIPVPCILYY